MRFEIVICPECESDKVSLDGDFYFCTSCGKRWFRYKEEPKEQGA